MSYVPRRGDFIKISFNPGAVGHEQMDYRPALVISQDSFNKTGFSFVCPITNTNRGNILQVEIPKGLPVTGVIMVDQMRAMDCVARKAKFAGECPESLFMKVLQCFRPLIF